MTNNRQAQRMKEIIVKSIQLGLLCFAFCPQLTSAQSTVTKEQNKPVSGDKLERIAIEGLQEGAKRDHVLWDFSHLTMQEATSPIRFSIGKQGFHSTEPGIKRYYLLSEDSLLECGYQSKLETMTYIKPQVAMIYPFCFGDSISSSFYGEGKYGDTYRATHEGTKTIVADARGSILLPDNKLLKGVLRIHTKTKNNILLEGMDPNLVDTATANQEIKDEYLWYAKGCRYPIIEQHISKSISNGSLVGTKEEAYCYFPDGLMENAASQDEASFPITYKITQMGNTLKLSYTSNMDVSVNFMIVNTMGMVYQSKTLSCKDRDSDQVTFNCSGYQTGGYILYINANGMIKSEKFQVK